MEVAAMLTCPICEHDLKTRVTDGWLCQCGEKIPFGFEQDDNENCVTCPIRDCPRRK
jgi:hypothetical protein